MRQVGAFASQSDAQRFADYLLTLGVSARVDPGTDSHSIWVFEENDVERAKSELDEFRRHPQDPRFVAAAADAARLRQAQIDQRRKSQAKVIELSERWRRPSAARAPLTMFLIAASVLVSGATDFGKRPEVTQWVQLSAISPDLPEVRQGQIWRLFTPVLLHYGVLHLLFDMYWLYLLGGLIEIRRGTLVLAALVFTSALVSNLGENLASSEGYHLGGMSGVDYALFGYCWMKSRFDPAAGIFVDGQTVFLLMAWLLICMTGYSGFGLVANTAHVLGLVVGVASGYLPHLLLRR